MALPSKTFTSITDVRVQPDAPVDTTLMRNLRDNDIHVNERIGIPTGPGTPDQNHGHQGLSKDGSVEIAGTTGGISVASGLWIGQGEFISMNLARFQPEFMMFAQGSRRVLDVHIKHDGDDINESTGLSVGTKNTSGGIERLTLGGAKLIDIGNFSVDGDSYAGLLLKSNTDGIKIGTYTGTPSAQSITGIGFQPEVVLVWRATSNVTSIPVIKTIGMASADSKEFGGNASPFDTNQITSFDIDGFSVGTDSQVNANNVDYVFLALQSFSGGESIAVNTYVGDGIDARVLFTNDVDSTGFNPQWAWIINTDTAGTNRAGVVAAIEMNGATDVNTGTNSFFVEAFIEGGILVSTDLRVNGSGDNYVVIFFQSGVRP